MYINVYVTLDYVPIVCFR